MSLINNVKRAVMGGSSRGEKTPSLGSAAQSHDMDCNQSYFGGTTAPSITISSFWGVDDYISAADWIDLYDSICTDYDYSELNKVVRLGGHLRKYALSWYVETIKEYNGKVEEIDWRVLKDNFKKHFILCNIMEQHSEASSTKSGFSR